MTTVGVVILLLLMRVTLFVTILYIVTLKRERVHGDSRKEKTKCSALKAALWRHGYPSLFTLE